MEAKHKELLEDHRSKFVESVEVERLYPFLKGSVLTNEDVEEIGEAGTTQARVERLLNILPRKGSDAFQVLCVALETTYPHLLTLMFLGAGGGGEVSPSMESDSRSSSSTSVSGDGLEQVIDSTDDESNGLGARGSYLRQPPNFPPPPPPTQTPDSCQDNVSLLRAELKLVSSDRDVLREELAKVHSKLDIYKKLSTRSSPPPLPTTPIPTTMSNGEGRISDKHRDYDWLKSQCESAMNELLSLKRQHSDTMKRCEQSVKEADYLRRKHEITQEKLEQAMSDNRVHKTQNRDLLLDKQRLENEVEELQKLRDEDHKEIVQLRNQQREVINKSGSNEVLNSLYDAAIDKCDSMKKDYDNLRKRYTDLLAQHDTVMNTVEVLKEESIRTRKELDKLAAERNGTIMEMNKYKQQCNTAILQWHSAIKEKEELEETLAKVTVERDSYRKGINQAVNMQLKTTKDLDKFKGERDAALKEYSLIMLERDSVHKEIELLQEKLSEKTKLVEHMEKEKKNTQDEMNVCKREMVSALDERARSLKDCQELSDRFGDIISRKDAAQKEIDEVRIQYEIVARERDVARRERQEALEHRDQILRDAYEKTQKEKAEGKDHVTREVEALKREVDKLQTELADALQEAEVSKRRRDYAFKERDKIVQERDSIRTLCDNLRRERDCTVSKLAEALRDSDELKKQKNEAVKELKDLREKYEAALEKESRKQQLNSVGHNNSRDSAIDTDLQEWETETLELEIGGMNSGDLGFDLVGGKDDPQFPNDSSIFISTVTKGGAADGKLKEKDQLIKVNSVDVTNVERHIAVQALRNSGGIVSLVVRRRRLTSAKAVPIHLNLTASREVGIHVEPGLYISRIVPGSSAAKEGNLAVGDRILNVNGHSVENRGSKEVMQMMSNTRDNLSLTVLKCHSSPHPSLVSSSASSGHNLTDGMTGGDQGMVTSSSPNKSSSSQNMWLMSPSSNKENQRNAKMSGSRTDSLDSPEVTTRKGKASGNNKNYRHSAHENIFDKAYDKLVRKFRQPKHSADRDGVDNKNVQQISQSTTKEEEAIAELDTAISSHSHYTKNNNNRGRHKSKDRHKSERWPDNNGGTWPRMHGLQHDFSGAEAFKNGIPNPKHKERPPLTAISSFVNENPYTQGPNQSTLSPPSSVALFTQPQSHAQLQTLLVNKKPPTPPERGNSSFVASIRHSPQNSDSTLKYVHDSDPVHANQASKSSQYLISSPTSPVQNSANTAAQPTLQSVIKKASTLDSDVNKNTGRYTNSSHGSLHYPTSSSPAHAVDYSVVSNKDSAVLQHYSRRNPRPNSAPSNSRSRIAYAHMIHGTTPHEKAPQKPVTLNLQPHYFPRPNPGAAASPVDSGLSASPLPLSPQPLPAPYGLSSHEKLPHSTGTSSSTQVPLNRHPQQVPLYIVKSQQVSASPSHPVAMTSQPISPRYVSPSTINPHTMRHEIFNNSIPELETDPTPYHIHYSASPSPSFGNSTACSTPTPSEDFSCHRAISHPAHIRPMLDMDGHSTFPSRKPVPNPNERIRIPSTPSVTSRSSTGRISAGSMDRMSDRSSPTSPSSSNSMNRHMNGRRKNRPKNGETRNIFIEKSAEPLGIQIQPGNCGGIFVSSVSTNSLAAEAGLEVGDQLLDVCGINLRNASYNAAANVLRQCGDSITMLVQYNPKKYYDGSDGSEGSGSGAESVMDTPEPMHKRLVSKSNSNETITSSTPTNSPLHKPTKINQNSNNYMICEPRFVFLSKTTSQLGVSLTGGNATGIFVRDVQPDSPSSGQLRPGDQLLEYNGVNLRTATAEEAAYELSKPGEKVSILAQYNQGKYNTIRDQAGDSFYVRATFDRTAENENELSFKKDDILHIDNTMHNGVMGMWRAWLVDELGNKMSQLGTVPSRARMEDEFVLKRSISETLPEDDSNKASHRTLAEKTRRSFFRRKRHGHQRNNSKDSREFNSFSDASINSDSIPMLDDGSLITYQRVEMLDVKTSRPVVILGPLAEPLINKLTSESPDKFCRCEPEIVRASLAVIEKGQREGVYIEARPCDDYFECIRVESVKAIVEKGSKHENRHCLLDIHPSAVERLLRVKIHPITLFIKHKSAKQIREAKDTRFLPEKISHRGAKEFFETFTKYEQEYKHLISTIIQGGNLALMCNQLKSAIDAEQKKKIWIPSGSA